MPIAEAPLAMAERHVAEAERRIDRQLAIIVRLTLLDQNTALAKNILYNMVRTLVTARQHRDFLQQNSNRSHYG